MAQKAKSKTKKGKERKTTFCVTRTQPGGGIRKTCAGLTTKQQKKLYAELATPGSGIKLIERFD